MDDSIFGNWLWWMILGCLVVWWWPKKVKASYFSAQAVLTIEALRVESQSDSIVTLPTLELISQNWGLIKSDTSQPIYQLTQGGEYVEMSGCHSQEDLNEILPISNQKCQLIANETLAVPYLGQLFSKIGQQYLPIKPVAKKPELSELLLTEVMWMGSYDGDVSHASDEWIELFNNSDQTLSLGGVKLVGAGVNGQTLSIPADFLLPPFTFFIIGKYGVDNSQLNQDPDLIFPNLSLSNSSSNLQLLSENDEILDQLPGGKWKAGINDTINKRRASAQRAFFANLGNDWSAWTHCEAETCLQLDTSSWKTQPAIHNFGTPWQPSVF